MASQGIVIGFLVTLSVILISSVIAIDDDSTYSPLYSYRYDQLSEHYGISMKGSMTDGWEDQSIKETKYSVNTNNWWDNKKNDLPIHLSTTAFPFCVGGYCTVATTGCTCNSKGTIDLRSTTAF